MVYRKGGRCKGFDGADAQSRDSSCGNNWRKQSECVFCAEKLVSAEDEICLAAAEELGEIRTIENADSLIKAPEFRSFGT